MAFDLFWIYFVILAGSLLCLNVKYYTIQENILWFVLLLYHNVVYLHCDNKTTDNNKQKHTIMKTFDSLNADFRRAFKQAAKQGIVKFTVEGIKDDPDSIYPMFEVSNNHVTYYSVQRQESVCITDMKIKAVIY